MITSHQNRKLREIRKLRQRRRWRERSQRFVAEGEDLLVAADKAGWRPLERYCAAGSGLPGIEVDAEALTRASGLASGTRTLAVYEERWADAPTGPVCVYLHGVQDPGNVGTILRSAEAFGAASVALGSGTADPFSPHAVRASMGAIFTVPVTREGDPGALPGAKIALVPSAGVPLDELQFTSTPPRSDATVRQSGGERGTSTPPRSDATVQQSGWGSREAADPYHADVTLLVGAERDGLPEALVKTADHVAHIPIETDSLNAAMAATVALYEITRKRRMARA